MFVTYCVNGEAKEFEIEDTEDTRELLLETVRGLRERHEELNEDPALFATVADRALNSLADDSDVLDLGYLP